MRLSHLLFTLLMILSGCATRTGIPRLTEAQAISIAEREAKWQGYKLSRYQSGKARPDGRIWAVHFEAKSEDGYRALGDHFMVIVDDRNGYAQLSPGQ